MKTSLLSRCSSEIAKDDLNFGISCTKKLLDYSEIVVKYPSAISRLKKEAADAIQPADAEAWVNADFLVFTNATLLTMEYGNLREDILYDAILVSRGGQIEAIVGVSDAVIPYGATVIDLEGGASGTIRVD